MIQHTRSELHNLGFRFVDRAQLGIDIIFPTWRGSARCTLRVYINTRHDIDYLVVARPGLGGTFRNSYDYIAEFPVARHGQARIIELMRTSRTPFHRYYHESPKYASYVARAIELAKYSLKNRPDNS